MAGGLACQVISKCWSETLMKFPTFISTSDADCRSTLYCQPAELRLHAEGNFPWPPGRREESFIHRECLLRVSERQDSRSLVGNRQGGHRSPDLAAILSRVPPARGRRVPNTRRLPLVSNFLLRVAASGRSF